MSFLAPILFFDCGIHARDGSIFSQNIFCQIWGVGGSILQNIDLLWCREWISPATCLQMIEVIIMFQFKFKIFTRCRILLTYLKARAGLRNCLPCWTISGNLFPSSTLTATKGFVVSTLQCLARAFRSHMKDADGEGNLEDLSFRWSFRRDISRFV